MQYTRIRDLRIDHDLTQAEVGAKIHVSQRAYGYYESGQRTLPPSVLCALADLYDTSVDYLLNRTELPDPYPKLGIQAGGRNSFSFAFPSSTS